MKPPKDMLNRELTIGDKLMPTSSQAPIFTIVDIKPMNMDPRMPPDAMLMTVQCTMPIICGSKAMPGFVRVQAAIETEEGVGTDAKPGDTSPEKQTTRIIS